MNLELSHERIGTPLGPLSILLSPRGVCQIAFGASELVPRRFEGARVTKREVPSETAGALARYFEGDLRALEQLPLDISGTPFQWNVWQVLRSIVPGHTSSYGDVAREVGRPRGFRAVGMANHANPVPLVIPCHRVIAADGTLGGYGGGVLRKAWLLRHEGYLLA